MQSEINLKSMNRLDLFSGDASPPSNVFQNQKQNDFSLEGINRQMKESSRLGEIDDKREIVEVLMRTTKDKPQEITVKLEWPDGHTYYGE